MVVYGDCIYYKGRLLLLEEYKIWVSVQKQKDKVEGKWNFNLWANLISHFPNILHSKLCFWFLSQLPTPYPSFSFLSFSPTLWVWGDKTNLSLLTNMSKQKIIHPWKWFPPSKTDPLMHIQIVVPRISKFHKSFDYFPLSISSLGISGLTLFFSFAKFDVEVVGKKKQLRQSSPKPNINTMFYLD